MTDHAEKRNLSYAAERIAALQSRIAELERERDAVLARLEKLEGDGPPVEQLIEHLDGQIRDLLYDVARKDEALRPFAEAAIELDRDAAPHLLCDDHYKIEDALWNGIQPTVGDLRRARAALSPEANSPNQQDTGLHTTPPQPVESPAGAEHRVGKYLADYSEPTREEIEASNPAVDKLLSESVPVTFPGTYVLPCDVHLPPNTIIRKGCSLVTLMVGLERRSPPAPERTSPFPEFEPNMSWADEDPGRCAWCQLPHEWVRPGKTQPTCDCENYCRAHEPPVRFEYRTTGNPQGYVCPVCWPHTSVEPPAGAEHEQQVEIARDAYDAEYRRHSGENYIAHTAAISAAIRATCAIFAQVQPEPTEAGVEAARMLHPTTIAEQLVDMCRASRLGVKQKSIDYNLDNKRQQCIQAVAEALAAARAAQPKEPPAGTARAIYDPRRLLAEALCYNNCRAASCNDRGRCQTSYPSPGAGDFERWLSKAGELIDAAIRFDPLAPTPAGGE